jgi:hypothetical protein
MQRLVVLALIALMHPANAKPASSPEATSASFLQAYEPLGAGGLPTRSEMGPLLRFTTPSLADLLRTALRLEEESRCEGPPSIEGDLLWSLAEGAQHAQVKTCRVQGASARCDIALRYTDRLRNETEQWVDKINLRKINGIWLVDEVLTGAEWAPRRALKKVLVASIRANRSCAQ